MSEMSVRIVSYHSEDDAIHCTVCDKDGMVGVTVTFDSGFMTDADMCMSCLKEVLAFKERMMDPDQHQSSAEEDQLVDEGAPAEAAVVMGAALEDEIG